MKKYIQFFFSVFFLAGFFLPAATHATTESVSLIRQDCTGYTQCYTSLSAWESARQRDLVALDEIETARIEGPWTVADPTPVSISGWTTDATRYIKIYTTADARHGGKWDDTKYRISSGSWGAKVIENNQNYTRIEGVQVLHSGGGGASIGIYSVGFAGVVVKDSIARKTSTIVGEGIKVIGTSTAASGVINSVAYGGWDFGINVATSGGYGYAYNTTSYGNNYGYNGFYIQNLKNCIGASNTIADFARQSSYAVNTTTCASSDTTAIAFTDAGSRAGQTFGFVDPANGNFHLSSVDASVKNMGTDLSADIMLAFTTDIDGETRSGSWDIGADEYGASSGGSGSVSPPVVTDTTVPVRSNGSPSGALASGTTQATLAVTTNESATCRYASTAGNDYLIMAGVFATTNGTAHTSSVSVQSGQSYTYYVRCKDTASNTTMDDYVISFSVAQAIIAVPSEATPSTGGPILNFSDLISGPKAGNTDGLGSGAIVSIWGNNLGSAQGSSQVYVGGVPVSHVYYWGNADGSANAGPADLYTMHKMQTVSFAIPAGAPDGATIIQVAVGGVYSNTLPFTVRSGNIYFIKTGGNNASSGTWQSPWGTFETNGSSKMTNGDILYVAGAFSSTGGTDGLLIRYNDFQNTVERPTAVIGYPGSSVYMNGSSNGIGVWNAVPYPQYWVFSKLKVETGSTGISSIKGMRAVANEITGPLATGQSGAISGSKDNTSGVKSFGNYIHDFGLNSYDIRLHHVFYLSNRDGTPNEAYELGWNYLLNNHARGGLHNYDEGICGDFTGVIKVHHNVVANQSGTSFDVGGSGNGYDGTGCLKVPFEVYNNLFINSGQSPFSDPAISVTYSGTKSHIKFYNNTLYGWSSGEAVYIQDNGSASWNFGGTFEWVNNIVVDTNNLPYSHSVYYKIPSVHGNNIWYNGGDGNPSAVPVWDAGALSVNPLFVNPSANDFRLQSSSPAINAGASLVSSLVASDLSGVARPQGSAYDIGAYEYCMTCTTSSVPAPTVPASQPTVPTTPSGAPAIFYTDIVSGPSAGGQNNKGVFVRVFGKNFGATRGSSQVTIGGGFADNYPTWSDGEVSFQLGANAQTGNIVVTTPNGTSNGLPFTVRSGNIYFVDMHSQNDPGSGTFTDPWRSPSSFYNNAQPGDTMYMRGGVYAGEYGYKNWGANFAMRIGTGSGFTRAGTEAMPIAYLAYPGEGVTLSAPGPTGIVRAFRVAANSSAEAMPDWIVVGNFAMESYNACIANGGNPGIYGSGWRIVNNDCLGLTITQQVQTGSIVPGGDHSKVLGNKVHGGRTANKLDHAIYSQACGDQVEIGWNHIYDNSFDTGPLISINYEGIRCTARGDGYAGAIFIHDNVIDATNYPSRGVYAYEQDWDDGDAVLPITYVYNNIFIGVGGPGASGALVVRNGGMEAYNNSFYNTNHACLELSGPTPNIEHLVFKNNICHMKSIATTYIGYPQDAPSVRDVRDNIYFGLGGYTGTLDVHPINADPLYVNPAGGIFSLQAGSPGINAGSSLASALVAKDHNGIARPQGSAYDIGAYEYCIACVASSASAPIALQATQPTSPLLTPTTTTSPSSTAPASQSTSAPTTTSAGGGSLAPASSSTPQTQTTASSGIKEGSLIRGPDGIKVYIVNAHGYKRHIFNPAIFAMYGHFKWNEIKAVDQKTLDSYITSDLYRADGDTKVFSLHEIDESRGLAQKRWFNLSATAFMQKGYAFTQVFIINPRERDYYQEGVAISQ